MTIYKSMKILILLNFIAISCIPQQEKNLPVIKKVEQDFLFTNQDSQSVDLSTFENKVYVTDFFFTTCPTICPKMKQQMIRLHEEFSERNDFLLLSHSIDTRHDSVAVLKDYASRLGVLSEDWHFVTGKQDEIFDMAKYYQVSALEDENEAGGYVHSGAFILVDKDKNIRGYYDGTDPVATSRLLDDVKYLLEQTN